MMTLQQILDTVAPHLLRQNDKARGDLGCVYRATDGKKCAVGVLIPDGAYTKAIEQCTVNAINLDMPAARALRKALIASDIDVDDNKTVDFLSRLQSTHDHYKPTEWLGRLVSLANEYGLDTAVLQPHREGAA